MPTRLPVLPLQAVESLTAADGALSARYRRWERLFVKHTPGAPRRFKRANHTAARDVYTRVVM